jgi:hypothetical protein
MATKGVNPFEKSKKDVDSAAVTKKYGKEGSKKEEAFDKMQMSGAFKKGGAVKKAPAKKGK